MSWTCDSMREAFEMNIKKIHKGAKAVVSTKLLTNAAIAPRPPPLNLWGPELILNHILLANRL